MAVKFRFIGLREYDRLYGKKRGYEAGGAYDLPICPGGVPLRSRCYYPLYLGQDGRPIVR